MQKNEDTQIWVNLRDESLRHIFTALLHIGGYARSPDDYYPLLTRIRSVAHLVIAYIGAPTISHTEVAYAAYELGKYPFAECVQKIQHWPRDVPLAYFLHNFVVDAYSIRLLQWRSRSYGSLTNLLGATKTAFKGNTTTMLSHHANVVREKLLSELLTFVHVQSTQGKRRGTVLLAHEEYKEQEGVIYIVSEIYAQYAYYNPMSLKIDLWRNGVSMDIYKVTTKNEPYLTMTW